MVWHALTRTGTSNLVHLIRSHKQEHRWGWTEWRLDLVPCVPSIDAWNRYMEVPPGPACVACRGPPAALEEMATQLQRLMVSIDGEKTDAAAGLVCAKLLQDEAAAAAGAGVQRQEEQGDSRAPAAAAPAAAAAGGDGKGDLSLRSSQLLAWAEEVCRAAAAACPAAAGRPAGAADVQQALQWALFATAAYGARQHMWRRGKQGSCATQRQLSRLAAAARAEGAQPLAGWGGLAAAAAASGLGARAPSKAEHRDFAAARELLGAGCQIVSFSSGHKKRGLLPHLLALNRQGKSTGQVQQPRLTMAPRPEQGWRGQLWYTWHERVGLLAGCPPAGRSRRWCWALQATGSARRLYQLWSLRRRSGCQVQMAPVRQQPRRGNRSYRRQLTATAALLAARSRRFAGGCIETASRRRPCCWKSWSAASCCSSSSGLVQLAPAAWYRGWTAAAGSWCCRGMAWAPAWRLCWQSGCRPGSWVSSCGCGWGKHRSTAFLGHVNASTAKLRTLCQAWAAIHHSLHAPFAGPLSVWAYCPPGELCSGDLAAALGSACSLTAVLVGDDLAPRASSAAVRALVEQAIVGLARLRCAPDPPAAAPDVIAPLPYCPGAGTACQVHETPARPCTSLGSLQVLQNWPACGVNRRGAGPQALAPPMGEPQAGATAAERGAARGSCLPAEVGLAASGCEQDDLGLLIAAVAGNKQ